MATISKKASVPPPNAAQLFKSARRILLGVLAPEITDIRDIEERLAVTNRRLAQVVLKCKEKK